MPYKNDTGYPSVTDILRPWIDTRWFTRESRIRGDMVHDKIEADLKGRLCLNFNPKYQPYFENYKLFKPRIQKILICEERLVSPADRGFCGQPDLVFIDAEDGLLTVLDWKTAQSKMKYWPLQLGGYSLLSLSRGYYVEKIMSVRLREKNVDKYPLIDVYSLKESERLFINQLELFKTLT